MVSRALDTLTKANSYTQLNYQNCYTFNGTNSTAYAQSVALANKIKVVRWILYQFWLCVEPNCMCRPYSFRWLSYTACSWWVFMLFHLPFYIAHMYCTLQDLSFMQWPVWSNSHSINSICISTICVILLRVQHACSYKLICKNLGA